MLTFDEHIEHWVQGAERDLDSASNMLSSGIYDWCLFVGHLSLEKLLKALWIKTNQQNTPPKLHNLLRLAELSNLSLTDEQNEFLRVVNQFHLEARYQDFKDNFRIIANKDFTIEYFEKIKNMFSWLKSQIKS